MRPLVLSSMLTSVPPLLFSADVLKKCALLALHIIAEEGRDGDSFQVPGLGGRLEDGLPKQSKVGEGEAWSEDEDALFFYRLQ